MDHFGIGAALLGAARIFIQSARRTGRTTSLVESVKDGDRICFHNPKEAERVRRLCQQREVKVECIVICPDRPDQVFGRPTATGRTLFDHGWVEQYYLTAIERASLEIDSLQKNSSGFGAAHRETQRAAEEMMKWRF